MVLNSSAFCGGPFSLLLLGLRQIDQKASQVMKEAEPLAISC